MKIIINELLENISDPFDRWSDIEKPITKNEVFNYLEKNSDILLPKPYNCNWIGKIDYRLTRKLHISRIAFFVINEIKEPILLDTMDDALIYDGHHRLIGAIIKNQYSIDVDWCGDWERMELLFPKSIKEGLLFECD